MYNICDLELQTRQLSSQPASHIVCEYVMCFHNNVHRLQAVLIIRAQNGEIKSTVSQKRYFSYILGANRIVRPSPTRFILSRCELHAKGQYIYIYKYASYCISNSTPTCVVVTHRHIRKRTSKPSQGKRIF